MNSNLYDKREHSRTASIFHHTWNWNPSNVYVQFTYIYCSWIQFRQSFEWWIFQVSFKNGIGQYFQILFSHLKKIVKLSFGWIFMYNHWNTNSYYAYQIDIRHSIDVTEMWALMVDQIFHGILHVKQQIWNNL